MIDSTRPTLLGVADDRNVIRTPDQRLRIFVSSTLRELAPERAAVRVAITRLRLSPVMFETGARPHPPADVYRSYLRQSQVFVGIYWQSYGWVAPGEDVSGLEDEYLLSSNLPRLIYLKSPAPDREPRLAEMLSRIMQSGSTVRHFQTPDELQTFVEDDLAVLLSERFTVDASRPSLASPDSIGTDSAVADLPQPVTPLLGREAEVVTVGALLNRPDVRVVTLTGPGGIGKTRLAVEVARRIGPKIAPDGVRFVDLAAVPRPDLVMAAIASALGLATSSGRLAADVRAFLRERRLLLVLDNFDRLVGAAPELSELLSAAPGLRVLVTSRIVLRIAGEHEVAVRPLDTDAALDLFVARAEAAGTGFLLTADNRADVTEIGRRLDGLPLAIELAAAKIRLLPPAALLARLTQGTGLLGEGARDLPERQRTLRQTLDWSSELLSPPARTVLGWLSVFPAAFDVDTVESIFGGMSTAQGHVDVMSALVELVDGSLVMPRHDGQTSFSLLEIVREYAAELLAGTPDAVQAHSRHAAYFYELARPGPGEVLGPAQLPWLRRVDDRRADIRAAMTWCAEHDTPGPTALLIWTTWTFWWLRGHGGELTPIAARAHDRRGEMEPLDRARAIGVYGFVRQANGDLDDARALFEECLPLFQEADDNDGIAVTATVLGHLRARAHDEDAARTLLGEGLRRFQADGNDAYASLTYNFIGQVELEIRALQRAADAFADGLAASRRSVDRVSLLVSLYDMATYHQFEGRPADAVSLLREGLALCAETGDDTTGAYYLERISSVAASAGDLERAVRLRSASTSLLTTYGSGWLHAYIPRPSHDEATALRRELEPDAFRRAWSWGNGIEQANAYAYALHERP